MSGKGKHSLGLWLIFQGRRVRLCLGRRGYGHPSKYRLWMVSGRRSHVTLTLFWGSRVKEGTLPFSSDFVYRLQLWKSPRRVPWPNTGLIFLWLSFPTVQLSTTLVSVFKPGKWPVPAKETESFISHLLLEIEERRRTSPFLYFGRWFKDRKPSDRLSWSKIER